MKNNILLYTENSSLLMDLLSDEFNISIAKSKEEMLHLLQEHSFQLLIMSGEYILRGDTYGYKSLRDHPIFHDIPVIAYKEIVNDNLLTKLYSLNIKGYIEYHPTKENLLTRIKDVLHRSNPYIGMPIDRFIKAFIRYEEAINDVSNVVYLSNYLIAHYTLDNKKAQDIKNSIILLAIAFKKNKLDKIICFLRDISLSPYLERIMNNYKNPLSIDEYIIVISLQYGNLDYNDKYKIDVNSLNDEMVAVAKEAMQKRKIYISCSHDIYAFWERLDEVLNTYSKLSLENYHLYLHYIFKILYKALVNYGALEAEFDNLFEDVLKVVIIPKGCTDAKMGACIDSFEIENNNVSFEKVTIDAKIALLINLNKVTDILPIAPPKEKKIVDTSILHLMHYKDESKISAVDFLKDFEIDSDLLDDLADNEREAKSFLYFKESLTQEMLELVYRTYIKYTRLINSTIVFENLAYSIGALAEVIAKVDLESLDEQNQKILKEHVIGIIDDLGSWRKHIFIMQDTPDIHYLDASLLDNCSEIEALINPQVKESQAEEDESDLEFF
ncbi:MAG: hypothetical protein NTY39_03305 [Campylobacterales bacterium]|nr:hypothetical protein [Campylobacterales bacterium]